jgi:hypothetical protein
VFVLFFNGSINKLPIKLKQMTQNEKKPEKTRMGWGRVVRSGREK